MVVSVKHPGDGGIPFLPRFIWTCEVPWLQSLGVKLPAMNEPGYVLNGGAGVFILIDL